MALHQSVVTGGGSLSDLPGGFLEDTYQQGCLYWTRLGGEKKSLFPGDVCLSTVADFNISLSVMDGTTWRKIKKEVEHLNSFVSQRALIHILSCAQRACSRVDGMLEVLGTT